MKIRIICDDCTTYRVQILDTNTRDRWIALGVPEDKCSYDGYWEDMLTTQSRARADAYLSELILKYKYPTEFNSRIVTEIEI